MGRRLEGWCEGGGVVGDDRGDLMSNRDDIARDVR